VASNFGRQLVSKKSNVKPWLSVTLSIGEKNKCISEVASLLKNIYK